MKDFDCWKLEKEGDVYGGMTIFYKILSFLLASLALNGGWKARAN